MKTTNLQPLMEYIYINLINSTILTYINIRDILNALYQMIYSPNIFKFNYKKFFYYLTTYFKEDFRVTIIIPLYKIIDISKYTFQKYILKFSSIKFIIMYVQDLDLTHLQKHLHNELDLYHIYKKFILKFTTAIETFVTWTKKYESDKIDRLDNNLKGDNDQPSLIIFILNKLTKNIDIENTVYNELGNEMTLINKLLKFLPPIFILSLAPITEEELINYINNIIISFLYKFVNKIFYIDNIIKISKNCLYFLSNYYSKKKNDKIDIITTNIIDA